MKIGFKVLRIYNLVREKMKPYDFSSFEILYV
jgi:hypothetical protein